MTPFWRKTDFHYAPRGDMKWSRTHATVPTPLHLGDDVFRVLFSTRDDQSRNRVGYVDIELGDRVRLVAEARLPVFDLGKLGYFDCDGVYGTCIVRTPDEIRFYYAGWNAGSKGLFYSAIGLAVSRDGGQSFSRASDAPIVGRDEVDPWACMAPFVGKSPDNSWLMWYASGIEIHRGPDGTLQSRYDIKTATSEDGLAWTKTGQTAIGLGERDSNIARACVLLEDGRYRAWYPYIRTSLGQYRIGYGESADGLHFERMDEAPEARLAPGENGSGWDSDAVTYPHVFRHRGQLYMLYNGNQFGKTGFGLAIWAAQT